MMTSELGMKKLAFKNDCKNKNTPHGEIQRHIIIFADFVFLLLPEIIITLLAHKKIFFNI